MTKKPEAGFAAALAKSDRVALIAGSGQLPVEVAEGLERQGNPPFVVMLEGEADPHGPLGRHDGASLAIERLGSLLPLLKRNRITHIVLAGGVSRRPRWNRIRPSLSLFGVLPSLVKGLMRGDDGLLRVLVRYLERCGFRVVGAHQIVPDLLAQPGSITSRGPSAQDRRDLDAALEAARTIGSIDVGQAAVAIGGRAVALEDIEGTDRLLERVAAMRGHGRLAGKAGGVLVKCAKPGQELRTDLPAIGPLTITAAHRAGLSGIGVEAGHSIILQSGAVVEEADRLGIFVVGLEQVAKP